MNSPNHVRYPDHLVAPIWRELPVMGIPVRFASSSERIDAIVERAFGHWRALAPQHIAEGAPIEITLAERTLSAQDAPRRFVVRYGSGWLTGSDGVSMLAASIERGAAIAVVSASLVDDESRFRHEIVECATLLLVSRRDRTPMHASAVARDGSAVAFVGRSGAGKSTLTYACLRKGFDLLSEDVLHCSRPPAMRFWGNGGQVRLAPDARRWFSELNGLEPRLLENGKTKLVVPVERNALTVETVTFCIVERGSGSDTKIEQADAHELAHAVGENLEPGFELFPEIRKFAGDLLECSVYRLVVGNDPIRAAEVVDTLFKS